MMDSAKDKDYVNGKIDYSLISPDLKSTCPYIEFYVYLRPFPKYLITSVLGSFKIDISLKLIMNASFLISKLLVVVNIRNMR